VAALAASQIAKREDARTRNREAFPFAAELMDAFSQDFDDGLPPFDPKLIYAEENGRSIGKRPDQSNSLDGDRLVQMHDSFEFIKSRMRKKR
jgi:hypothetical protein